ncbi:MAG: 5-(carboxyamino)imidazole ribonucleotide synthase [Leadbetterella sp.]
MIESLKIGILGGGQLGKMLIQSGLDLDLQISVLDPDPSCPCKNICSNFTEGDLLDFDTVYSFGKNLDLLTIEIENVNIEALKKLEGEGKKVFPQPHIVENIKNKVEQKEFYKRNGIPTADFIRVDSRADIHTNRDFLPAVNKVATGGYDGKGVEILRSIADIERAFDAPGLLEKLIPFEKELAVIVARSENGETKTFPSVEMVFHPTANLVEYLFSPAKIDISIQEKAEKIAIDIANSYEIVGLLAVEMFLCSNGEILVNEVAPRPHNSGHHTLRANECSQYDQHWRAILGLPLESTKAHSLAAMVNLLGEKNASGSVKILGLDACLDKENIYPYFYGKKQTRPFRKMGHATILASDFEILKEKVTFVQENLIITAQK